MLFLNCKARARRVFHAFILPYYFRRLLSRHLRLVGNAWWHILTWQKPLIQYGSRGSSFSYMKLVFDAEHGEFYITFM